MLLICGICCADAVVSYCPSVLGRRTVL